MISLVLESATDLSFPIIFSINFSTSNTFLSPLILNLFFFNAGASPTDRKCKSTDGTTLSFATDGEDKKVGSLKISNIRNLLLSYIVVIPESFYLLSFFSTAGRTAGKFWVFWGPTSKK
jgi:hypothetical protein